MPHFEHVAIVFAIIEVMDGVLTDVLIEVLAMSSRSGIGRRDTYWRVPCVLVGDVHTVCDIDPGEPSNMPFLLALLKWIQAAPQSFWLNDAAFWNM